MRLANIELNSRLELELMSLETGQTVKVKMTRIFAQKMADMLLQYSGSHEAKSMWGSRESWGAEDLTPPTREQVLAAKAKKLGPISLKPARKVVRY